MKLGGSLYESGRLRRKWTTKGGARGTPGTQDIRRRRARSGRDGGNSDGGGGGSAAQRADGGAAAHIGADQAGGGRLLIITLTGQPKLLSKADRDFAPGGSSNADRL